MTVEEVYTAIADDDIDTLTDWLNEVEVTSKFLKYLDSLCIHCVVQNKLVILKLFVEYAANLQVPWSSSYLLEYAVQLGRRDMTEYLKTRVDTDRNINLI